MAQTKIMYREKELMQLIHDHLVNKGEASQSEPVSQSLSYTAIWSVKVRPVGQSEPVSQSVILPSGQ